MWQKVGPAESPEASLREYILIPIRKWYLVISVLAITMATGWTVSSLRQDVPSVYETRTRLLLPSPTPDTPLATRGNTRALMSTEVLNALATANDLLHKVIQELQLLDLDTGRPLAVEQLGEMMQLKIEPSSRVLTMTVRGDDPEVLERVANKWAELFVEQTGELLAADTAAEVAADLTRSYDLLINKYVARHEEMLAQLQSKQASLTVVQTRLKSTEAALAAEPQFLTLQRSISDDAIWAILANDLTSQATDRLTHMTIVDTTRNELYFSLKAEMLSLRAHADTLNAEIAELQAQTGKLQLAVSASLNRTAAAPMNRFQLDNEIQSLTSQVGMSNQLLLKTRDSRTPQPDTVRVIESAIRPQVPMPSSPRRNLAVATPLLGLMLGVALALVVDYLQGPAQSVRRRTPLPSEEPAP